jgi:hypothetical protein
VVVTKSGADFVGYLKATCRCQHLDSGRLEGVITRETNSPMVDASFIRAILETKYAIVPFKYIIFFWDCHKVGEILSFEQILEFSVKPDRAGHTYI